jgi:hypothetical protein
VTLFEIQQLLRQDALAVFIGVVLVAAGLGAVALAARSEHLSFTRFWTLFGPYEPRRRGPRGTGTHVQSVL